MVQANTEPKGQRSHNAAQELREALILMVHAFLCPPAAQPFRNKVKLDAMMNIHKPILTYLQIFKHISNIHYKLCFRDMELITAHINDLP